jgi:hypothetical protein
VREVNSSNPEPPSASSVAVESTRICMVFRALSELLPSQSNDWFRRALLEIAGNCGVV